MSAITVVVFDLDGTLIDSAPDLQTALNRMLAKLGRRALGLEEVTAIIGDGARILVERALVLTGGASGDDLPRLTSRFLDDYENRCSEQTRVYPGVVEALDRLAGSGLAFGVCTNKPERATRSILSALGLAHRFSAIIGGDSLDGIRKPDPRPLLATLTRLDARPDAAVMVGDSLNDVAAARAADVPVIFHAGGYGRIDLDSLDVDAVIHDFTVLPDAIRKLS